ncbi:MAG TPA: hypothetical protein VGT04_10560 [Acidobacteriaceae bacterium]|nr:hypothetical protein [Acidobacteriaceae bacterium]
MTAEVCEILEKIVGLPCTRKEFGFLRSLSLGFGDEASAETKKRNRQYRLWEIGTYSAAWQITNRDVVLLSKDQSGNADELDARLQGIPLGRFKAVRQISETNLELVLDNELLVKISGNAGDYDEYFHVFCPEKRYVEFSKSGWVIGRSDVPWDE